VKSILFLELHLSGPDEKELVSASQHGSRQAYSLLVERYSRQIFGICFGVLGNAADAEDATQDTLVKGFRGIETCRNGSSFGAWLGQVARNLCLDLLRQRKTHQEWLHEQVPTASSTPQIQTIDLESHLARLPIDLRLPLLMFYFDGQNSRTIAEKLELSHTTVCQRIKEARKELHRLLTEGECP
jgi:RNA polymerase sigma-70 factor, ECF subfamily